jgi:hypothetical protein
MKTISRNIQDCRCPAAEMGNTIAACASVTERR